LEIVDVAFQVRCRSCGHEMTADDLVVQCERCGSVDLETLAGTELFLMKMDVEI
jgi:Zn finger protein HypA/HybF involved in hydrogenase expression